MNGMHTWYVSYESNGEPKFDGDDGKFARATRTFIDESEAKRFAREIVDKGWSASAGTLNPHTPKRIIAGAKIPEWLDGPS